MLSGLFTHCNGLVHHGGEDCVQQYMTPIHEKWFGGPASQKEGQHRTPYSNRDGTSIDMM